ncbi:hypothetical protein [Salinithrix halophila]
MKRKPEYFYLYDAVLATLGSVLFLSIGAAIAVFFTDKDPFRIGFHFTEYVIVSVVFYVLIKTFVKYGDEAWKEWQEE